MVLQSSNQMVSHSQLQQLKLQLSTKIHYCQVKKILPFILFLCYSPSWMMLCSIANYPGIIKTLILIYIKVCRSWSVIILFQILIFVYGSQCMSVHYWRSEGRVDCVIFAPFSGGDMLTINGTGFGASQGDNQVYLTSVSGDNIGTRTVCDVTDWSDTQINCTTPR